MHASIPPPSVTRPRPGPRRHPRLRLLSAGIVPVALLALLGSLPVAAAPGQKLRTIITEEQALQRAETDAQARVDKLADETEALLADYRAVLDQTESLAVYNRQIATMVAAQEARLAGFDARLANAEETQRNVAPLLERMLEVLERFVAADLPFLAQERSERLAGLRQLMDDPAQTISERYRRVLEAHQIEMDYGRTIEAWRGSVDLGRGEQVVDHLRIGRLALYCLSLDGQIGARWNAATSGWEPLADHELPGLERALRVARKELPPELFVLPAGAP
jgi:hypothetical protein